MTKYTFRQGIAKYPTAIAGSGSPASIQGQAFLQVSGSFVNLLADNGPTVVNFAHKSTNYEFSEGATVNAAWDLTGVTLPAWIYWDLDQSTGVRTFGFTTLAPTSGPTAPSNPTDDQHWFDTTTFTMKVYNAASGRFVERIRVFAAQIQSSTSILPLGSNQSLPYAGSQVGLSNTPVNAGRILFDESGEPAVRVSNRTFLTTEDQFFTGANRINGIRLESDVITVTASENIPAYAVVEQTANGQVRLANYNNSDDTTIGIAVEEALLGESLTIILNGVITNEQWNWPTAGQTLWVEDNGVLTDVDPNLANSVAYPRQRAPIARVLGTRQIVFLQGLGAIGPKGEDGPPADQVKATDTILGNVVLSVPPLGGSGSPLVLGGSPLVPIAVGTNDPRLVGGPFLPTTHLTDSAAHTATNIAFTSFGDISAVDVQTAIQQLETQKIDLDGGNTPMTGFLTLVNDPVNDLHAATKNYVDNLVSGLIWLDPVCLMNLISDAVSTPPGGPTVGDTYIMPSGPLTGAWSGFAADDVVQWDGSAWDNGGNIDVTFPSGRFVVSGTSATVPSGTFTGQNNNVAIRGGSPIWSYEIPVMNNAVFVCNEFSAEAFGQFVFDSDVPVWVQFNGGQIVPGLNLSLSGNQLNVLQWSGSPSGTIDAATLQGNTPSAFAPATHTHNYDLASFLAGVAVTDEPVGSWLLTRDLTVPVNFVGSVANTAQTGSTIPSTLNILQNGTIVGTITFPVATNAGTFASVGSPVITSYSSGDLITLQWGSPSPDTNIKNVTVTLETCASAPSC